ncbi:hypothetical protein [Streptomyces sp. NPDC060010]|uniref:hypothetical protein n=1 Tax=Streptomyces sp. NPDC060010 TaxID=3347036 RepID=UPI00369A4281
MIVTFRQLFPMAVDDVPRFRQGPGRSDRMTPPAPGGGGARPAARAVVNIALPFRPVSSAYSDTEGKRSKGGGTVE